ncbi:hypothetical protein ACFQH8_14490 [Halomicroarcula sp. GCM10025710]
MDVVADDSFEEVEVEPGVFLAQMAAGDEMSIQHLRMAPGAACPNTATTTSRSGSSTRAHRPSSWRTARR